jgi:hypothetical protein
VDGVRAEDSPPPPSAGPIIRERAKEDTPETVDAEVIEVHDEPEERPAGG